jgi:hypothetical protein
MKNKTKKYKRMRGGDKNFSICLYLGVHGSIPINTNNPHGIPINLEKGVNLKHIKFGKNSCSNFFSYLDMKCHVDVLRTNYINNNKTNNNRSNSNKNKKRLNKSISMCKNRVMPTLYSRDPETNELFTRYNSSFVNHMIRMKKHNQYLFNSEVFHEKTFSYNYNEKGLSKTLISVIYCDGGKFLNYGNNLDVSDIFDDREKYRIRSDGDVFFNLSDLIHSLFLMGYSNITLYDMSCNAYDDGVS